MKHLLYLIILLSVATRAGVDNATTLCVENKNGETVSFALSEHPKMLFKGNYVVIQASSVQLFQFRNLARAYFLADDDPTGINDATASGESISSRQGSISLSNFKPLTRVLVYTTSGTLLRTFQTDVKGCLSIEWKDLPSGVCIIKAGKTSFKYVVR